MSDMVTPVTPTAQAATPEPQAGDGQQTATVPEPAASEPLTPEQLREQLTRSNSEAAATRKKLREAEKLLEAAAKAQEDAAAAQAAEQGRYQELYEQEKAAKAALEARVTQIERDALRKDIAQTAGIPALWERLQGETAEELTADAQALAAMMQPPAPAANGQRQAPPPTPNAQGAAKLTEQERRARATRTF